MRKPLVRIMSNARILMNVLYLRPKSAVTGVLRAQMQYQDRFAVHVMQDHRVHNTGSMRKVDIFKDWLDCALVHEDVKMAFLGKELLAKCRKLVPAQVHELEMYIEPEDDVEDEGEDEEMTQDEFDEDPAFNDGDDDEVDHDDDDDGEPVANG